MKTINVTGCKEFPLKWANLNNYTESKAYRKEIYLKNDVNIIDGLLDLFYSLFNKYKTDILIYDSSWWDFTLETWNFQIDTYDYSIENKSKEAMDYLQMLYNSKIEKGYSGVCECLDWEKFLQIILPCIISHKAPYSPIFFNVKEDFFFYFHYSGSIGIYYEKNNNAISQILNCAKVKYLIE